MFKSKNTIPQWFGISLFAVGIIWLLPAFASAQGNPAGFETSSIEDNDCAAKGPITVAYSAWPEDVLLAKLFKQLTEKHYNCSVTIQRVGAALKYQGLADGDVDLMFEAWLPKTHEAYWQKFSTQVWDVGPLYMGAQLGWAVPDYVPEDVVSSIADLKKDSVRKKMRGRVQGIDPGSGLMQHSKDAIEDYGLDDYELVSASSAAMTAALKRAIDKKEWIVVTLWKPHWAFGRFDIHFLKDPKGSLGGSEHADKLVRSGFYQEYPLVTAMLSRMVIPLNTLQKFMYEAINTSDEEAIKEFIDQHEDDIHYWMTGEYTTD